MKKILLYLRPEKKILFLGLFMASLNQVFSLLNPQIFAKIIDGYASKVSEYTQDDFIRGVSLLLVLYVVVALISRTAKAFQDYFVNVISEKIGTKIYGEYVNKVFSLPFAIFENEQSGSILQKMQKARDSIKKLIENSINVGFFSLVGMIFVIAYAFMIHWSIALVFLLSIPILGIIVSVIGKGVKEAQQKIVIESAELAASTTETLQNVGLVKSLGLENQEINRLNDVNQKILGLEINKVIILRKLSFIQGTLVNTISSLIILVSMFLVFEGTVSLGQFLTLWFYGFFVFGPLSQLSTLVSSYQETMAGIKEVENILAKQKIAPSLGIKTITSLKKVEFNNVSFSYTENQRKPTIYDFSLEISSGETIGLVGPSGSGKSTILKLMLGLYQTNSGSLEYNSINSEEINMMSVRQQVGYVPQDTQVFAGSIRDNLIFVRPKASDEECLVALKQAQALGIIERTEQGLDTLVGENGIKLSGGERQRIAIARALLRNPTLLIFDEATSSLDSLTEQEITRTIKEIKYNLPNLMMVIVAHRLSTIEHVDTIYTLKNGTVYESGSHMELLEKKDLYYSLWNQQV